MKTFTKSRARKMPIREGEGGADILARPMAGPGRDSWSGYGTAYAIIGTLLAGMLVWGGIGFLVDRLVGTEPLFLASGLVVGMAGGIYLVYIRYGRDGSD